MHPIDTNYQLLVVLQMAATISVFLLPKESQAGLAVTDAALIASNRQHQQQDYIEQLLQELNQQTQIGQLAESVRQMDEQLERLGDPSKPIGRAEIEAMIAVLNQSVQQETSEEIVAEVDDASIFTGGVLPIYSPVERDIVEGGETIGQRDGDAYRPEVAARAAFERYRATRENVLAQKEQLIGALRTATAKLDAAQTTSEVQRLTAIILSIQTQLASVDNELNLATQEVFTRVLENGNEREIKARSEVERGRASLRHSHEKESRIFVLPSEPTLFGDHR